MREIFPIAKPSYIFSLYILNLLLFEIVTPKTHLDRTTTHKALIPNQHNIILEHADKYVLLFHLLIGDLSLYICDQRKRWSKVKSIKGDTSHMEFTLESDQSQTLQRTDGISWSNLAVIKKDIKPMITISSCLT